MLCTNRLGLWFFNVKGVADTTEFYGIFTRIK